MELTTLCYSLRADQATWNLVQQHLTANGRDGGARVRNPSGALLKGLVFCSACGKAMTPTHTKKGPVRYTYYACVTTQKRGKRACPTRPVRAESIESFVLDQIRAIGADLGLQRAVPQQFGGDPQQFYPIQAAPPPPMGSPFNSLEPIPSPPPNGPDGQPPSVPLEMQRPSPQRNAGTS